MAAPASSLSRAENHARLHRSICKERRPQPIKTHNPEYLPKAENFHAIRASGVLHGRLTYSFPDRPSDYEAGYTEALNGFAPVSFSQMQAARYILEGTSPVPGGPKAALTSVEGFTLATLVAMGFGGSDIRIARS